jgi:phage terminase small subunit
MIKDPNKLTLKQSRFVDYYLQTGNATQSAKLAGYNTTNKSHRAIGAQNLTKLNIKKAIQSKLIKDKINPTYVLSGISTLAESSSKDSDKLRAYELLGKYLKLFTDVNDNNKPTEIILKLGIDNELSELIDNTKEALKPSKIEPESVKTIK